MSGRTIRQPQNTTVRAQQAELKLVWSQTFSRDASKQFNTAQKFVDSEVLRRMVKYTPSRNNILSKNAVLGTKIGSGHIYYTSPYARYQYYGVVYGPNIPIKENGVLVGFYSPQKKYRTNRQLSYDKSRHPQAQRLWFEVMKKKHGQAILRGAAAATGGKV